MKFTPFNQRATAIIAIWAIIGLVQATLLGGAEYGWSAWPIAVYLSLAMYWAAMTPLVAWVDRTVRARAGTPALLSSHVALGLLALVVDTQLRRTLIAWSMGRALRSPYHVTLVYYADTVLLMYAAAVMISRGLDARAALLAQRQRALRLRAELQRAQLEQLGSQLHPHFVFNALGAVSELLHEAPERAAIILDQLDALIARSVEQSARPVVSIDDELASVEAYLDIHRVRFDHPIDFHVHVAPELRRAGIPSFLLQPIVENAVRHGFSADSLSWIDVRITASNGRLLVDVRNGHRGPPIPAIAAVAGMGIGLDNVRRRLDACFPDAWKLELAQVDDATNTHIELPLTRTSQPDVADARSANDETLQPVAESHPGSRFVTPKMHPAAALFVGWVVLVLFWTNQSYVFQLVRGNPAVTFSAILLRDGLSATIWACLTPIIFAMAKRTRLGAGNRHTVVLLLVTAPLIVVTHTVIARKLAGMTPFAFDEAFGAALTWNTVLFAIICAMAFYRRIEQWLAALELEAARLAGEAASHQLNSAIHSINPDVLRQSLRRARSLCTTDVAQCERLLSRLGDTLRAALESWKQSGDGSPSAVVQPAHSQ